MGTGEDERPWYRVISEKAHKEKLWEVNMTLTFATWYLVLCAQKRYLVLCAQKKRDKDKYHCGAENCLPLSFLRKYKNMYKM